MERILAASSALLLYDHHGGVWLGTAIAFRLGERRLLATAAHNLTSLKYLRPLPRGRYRGDPLRPTAMGVDAHDLGWIELCPQAEGRMEFLGPEDLSTEAPAARSLLLAHGFPASRVAPEQIRGTRFELSGCQIEGVADPADPRGEIRLRWAEGEMPDSFRPTGFSGGGMWRRRRDGRYALVGLIRAWHRPSRRLLGVPVGRWLDAVQERSPFGVA